MTAGERSCVVTGAAGGIGSALVRQLVSAGWAVVACDVSDDGLARLQAGLPSGRFALLAGDAGTAATAHRCAEAAEELAPLAGWVNNIGVFEGGGLHDTEPHDVLATTESNLRPAVVGCTEAVRRWLAGGRGGSIVNVSSLQASRVLPDNLGYSMAKAAIESLTRHVGVQYAASGIRCNAVAPGTIAIPSYRSALATMNPDDAAAREANYVRHHPIGRVGEPGEVAAAIRFLLSDDASFVTAAVLSVDGGWTADSGFRE